MQTHPISCRVTAPSPTQPSTRFSPSSSTPEGLQSSLTHQSPTTHAPPLRPGDVLLWTLSPPTVKSRLNEADLMTSHPCGKLHYNLPDKAP